MHRAISATIWSLIEQLGANGLSTFFLLALARLLTPEQFGAFAVASLIVLFSSRLAALGLDTVIVQIENCTDELFHSAIWITAALSVVISLVIAASLPLLSIQHGLGPLYYASLPLIAFNTFSSVASGKLRRELRVRILAQRTLVCNLAGGLGALPMAYCGFGVYALLGQQLISSLLGVALLARATGVRWPIKMRISLVAPLIPRGAPILANVILTQFNRESPRIFVGIFYGAAELGQMSVAMRIMLMILALTGQTIFNVSLPLLSDAERSSAGSTRMFLRMLRLVGSIVIPLFIILSFLGPQLVYILLGDQWRGTEPLMWPIFLTAILMNFGILSGNQLISTGRARTLLSFSFLRALLGALLFTMAAPFGLAYVAWAMVIRSTVIEPVQITAAARYDRATLRTAARWILTQGVAASIALLPLIGASIYVGQLNPLLTVAASCAIYFSLYATLIYIFDRTLFDQIRELITQIKRKAAGKP